MNLEGELGVLRQEGKQVAGVYNWESRIILNYTVKDSMREYKPTKIMKARSYWLVEPVTSDEFDIELLKVIDNALVVMDSGKVKVSFPDTKTIDRRLDAPLDLVWVGYEC